jgi:CheY-like chemotaxis protein
MPTTTILLAEDDADDQAFFCSFANTRTDLKMLPVAENGEELLTSLETASTLPDVIILDQNMPKRSGLQTLQILKTRTRYAHIPVVIYSTYADDLLKQQAIQLDAALVLTKPYTMEGYENMMNTVLKLVQ